MPQLELVATVIEKGLYRDAYDELSTDLAEQGWTVIEPRREYEQRSGGGLAYEGVALAIHLSEEVGRDVLALIVGAIVMRLTRRRRVGVRHPEHYAVIYDRFGGELSRIPLDREDDPRGEDTE